MSIAPTQTQPALTAAQSLTQAQQVVPSLTKASTQSIKPESPKLTLSSFPIAPFAFDASFGFGLLHSFGTVSPLDSWNNFSPFTSAYPFSGLDTFSLGHYAASPYYGSSFGAYPIAF